MASELGQRWTLLVWSALATALAAVSLALLILTVTGTALIVVSVGVPILLGTVYFTRPLAELHRRRIGSIDGAGPIGSPYLSPPPGGVLTRTWALFRDPARRRDAYWLLVNGTLGFALTIIALVESIVDLIFWWLPAGIAIGTHARICRAMLSVSEKSRLALRVEQLTESRAETRDTQAAELRRIERDLHDGAQARIVGLGMTLALAGDQLERDPAAARSLIAEAQLASSDALAELRDLVRGIHPPVLADRGLVGAVEALVLATPLPVTLSADVPGRLPAPVESAAYFAIAEAVTNVIKHSGAQQAGVVVTLRHDVLRIQVRDDGSGGVDASRGSGVHGIARRLSAFDGALDVSSPAGGPTELTMVLPCASSSPKTLPSSGTA